MWSVVTTFRRQHEGGIYTLFFALATLSYKYLASRPEKGSGTTQVKFDLTKAL